MAVEDLLDNSDLVANALAEAASVRVDQVRMATQSFKNTLIASTPTSQSSVTNNNKQPMPSAQGSRESQSPPNEVDTLPFLATTGEGEITLSVPVENELESSTVNTEDTTNENDDVQTDTESSQQQLQQVVAEAARGKEESLKRLEQISSSMSQVLDSISRASASSNRTGDVDGNRNNNDGDDDDNYEDVVVAENNFLNDNHNNVLEQEDYIAMLKRQEDADDTIGEEDDDDDDFDDDEFEEYGDEDIPSATIKANDYVIASVDTTTAATGAVDDSSSIIPSDPRIVPAKQETNVEKEPVDILNQDVLVLSNKHNETKVDSEATHQPPGDIPRDVLASMLQVLTGGGHSDSQENIDEITQQALRLLSGHRSDKEIITTISDKDTKGEDNKGDSLLKESPESAAAKSETENAPVATEKDNSPETNVQEGDVLKTKNEGASPTKEGIPTTMKTPDKNEVDMDTDMYTLEEILQLHKLSKMVAEKEKKIRTTTTEVLTKEEVGSDGKKEELVTNLKESQRFVLSNSIFICL